MIKMVERVAQCPIGGEKVDEAAARVNATLVVALLVAAVVTKSPWILGYLALDYLVKIVAGFACSPNCMVSRFVVRMLELESRRVDSAPKRFAALLAGLMSSIALMMAYSFHSMFWFNVVAALFIGVASLDAFADFCLGCYLYGLLPKRFSAALVRH
ncbi:MAG: hypothetical protein CVT67_01410 [Actinobacteria bacterium HGW-Actinobacteria-7]|nr:MAG: hypothetical protein CVT67_01410 [Actinobacteria bacterium HGW-Actinobacteria-7]